MHKKYLLVVILTGVLLLQACSPVSTATPSSTPEPDLGSTTTPLPTDTSTIVPSQTEAQIPTKEETSTTTTIVTSTTIPTEETSPEPSSTISAASSNSLSIVVDHTSVELFEQIPAQYLEAAQNMHMLFIDRSVGSNINDALNCLSYPNDESAPNHCSRYENKSPEFSVDPSEVDWSKTGGYINANWDFLFYEGDNCSDWTGKINCYFQMVEPVMDQYDVLSFQLSYLAVDEGSSITDQPGGYFFDNPDSLDVYDQEEFEARYPSKIFIYWTTSLARGIGSQVSEDFNNQMRQYAIENNKPLFDVADILSHDPDGLPCYDNRDGVEYSNGNNSENYPDDGKDFLAICQHYTTEIDGGHLGSVSAGKIRAAKAFWVLMAQIAGWDLSDTQ